MANAATSRQKQFLRRLGYKGAATLTKEQASALIDKLLAEEKATGKTFPCPYCKAKFGPRPKREKKCPACGRTIVHLCGKFYTEEEADALYQKDWLKDSKQDTKAEVADDWRDEKKYRKEYGEPFIVGYKIKAGAACPHAKHLEKLLVLIEDAYDTPDLLPPYENCKHDRCECEFTSVLADEVPKGTRVAQWGSAANRKRQVTRATSPVSIQRNSGCASVIALTFFAALMIVICLWYVGNDQPLF